MEITVASLTHSGSSNVYQPLFADFPYYVAGKHNSSASYQELCLFNGSPQISFPVSVFLFFFLNHHSNPNESFSFIPEQRHPLEQLLSSLIHKLNCTYSNREITTLPREMLKSMAVPLSNDTRSCNLVQKRIICLEN